MENMKAILADYEKSEKRVNVQMDILPILFRDEEIQRLVDVGCNVMALNEYQFGLLGEKVYEKVIEVLEDAGLDLRYQMWKSWLETKGIDRALNYDFTKHPCIKGISVYDEPTLAEIDDIKEIMDALHEKHPGMLITSNLYPCYVPESVIGSTYEEYIDKYFDTIIKEEKGERVVSCDYYPFEIDKEGTTRMPDHWAYNHMLFAKKAKEYNSRIEWCIQTSNYHLHRVVTDADVRLQTYMCFAFGVTTVICFTYATPMLNPDFPEGCNGMIGADFQPNSMYYDTQKVIKEIRKVEKIYMDFKWQGAKSFVGTNESTGKCPAFELLSDEMDNFTRISDVVCSENTIVSEMYDKTHDRVGYVLVNYNDPVLNKTDVVKFKLEDGKQAVVLLRGEPREVSGDVEVVLQPGDGAIVVVGK